jgi:hypothetical protein
MYPRGIPLVVYIWIDVVKNILCLRLITTNKSSYTHGVGDWSVCNQVRSLVDATFKRTSLVLQAKLEGSTCGRLRCCFQRL